jgi:inner membrane protein
MDPVTHMLTGALISRAGFNRKSRYSTATWVLASEAPDLDILYGIVGGRIAGFTHHRGWTHSFLGAPVCALAAVGLVYGIHRWRTARRGPVTEAAHPHAGPPPSWSQPRWGWLLLFALLSSWSHILLDYASSYGIRPFLPFDYHWYSWDIMYIIEPVWLLIAFAGLVLPSLFGLIQEEIGSRQRGPKGRGSAIFALVLILAFWGLRDYEHRRAIAMMNAVTYDGAEATRVNAYPYMLNPFRWMGVVETSTFIRNFDVDTLGERLDPDDQAATHYKPHDSPALIAAKGSRYGRVFMDWAVYPMAEVEPLSEGGYVVRFFDLRYAYPGRPPGTLGGYVELDRELHVVREKLGSRKED